MVSGVVGWKGGGIRFRGFVWEKGIHESRRRVKCQDHAWGALCKHKRHPRDANNRLTKDFRGSQYIVKCIRTVTTQDQSQKARDFDIWQFISAYMIEIDIWSFYQSEGYLKINYVVLWKDKVQGNMMWRQMLLGVRRLPHRCSWPTCEITHVPKGRDLLRHRDE